ncbi:hypothetical protein ERO13_A09G023950v2 [Gossypium hirsutum]|uniref:Extensin domain-containing protein n=2 Tax=Gossypium TaxID=3633 RepID=A0A5D2XSJ2_GOSMU|nr:hypothetical protein ERO13_A09G023950v2 [Gossypium hirsutum]TYJ17085.1 hypothetical protein E1A91_A09G027200v1 [Gossypium mustelinum]
MALLSLLFTLLNLPTPSTLSPIPRTYNHHQAHHWPPPPPSPLNHRTFTISSLLASTLLQLTSPNRT